MYPHNQNNPGYPGQGMPQQGFQAPGMPGQYPGQMPGGLPYHPTPGMTGMPGQYGMSGHHGHAGQAALAAGAAAALSHKGHQSGKNAAMAAGATALAGMVLGTKKFYVPRVAIFAA